jgi:hypothetical protein
VTLTGPAPTIDRDRWGRPLIAPPQPLGAKPEPYTRATTVAKTLDRPEGLMLWKQRMTLLGLVARPDLRIAAAATDIEDSKALNKLAEEAADAGGANAAATTGTALHAFTERMDRGLDAGHVPEENVADLGAYGHLAAEIGWTVQHVEQFTVLDAYRVAGTADRVVEIDGRWYIADLKTGASVSFHHAWAVQFAIYAHGIPYDIESKKRKPWAVVPETDRAIVIHLPAGKGTAAAYWIDIEAGWEAFRLSMQARKWLARRDLLTPYASPSDPVLAAIQAAGSADELAALWAAHRAIWTEQHTDAARARKAALNAP